MDLLNVKLELKLNEFLYSSGKISAAEYDLAKAALINRLTLAEENGTINYDSITERGLNTKQNEIT